MKIEQVAFGVLDPIRVVNMLYKIGITEWVCDEVHAKGTVFGMESENTALLHFNYQLGTELELLHYISGPNWLQWRNRDRAPMFLSHLGAHVTKREMRSEKQRMRALGIGIAQEVYTQSHTNPYLVGCGRKYHYIVFDSVAKLGYDYKLIRRIER